MTSTDPVNPAIPIAMATAMGVACSGRASTSACERHAEAGEHAEALAACRAEFRRSGKASAGARAAVAAYMTSDSAAGDALLEELGDDDAAGDAWRTAGDFRTFSRAPDAAGAYAKALAIHRRVGDDEGAARDLLSSSWSAWTGAGYESARERAAASADLARRAGNRKLTGDAVLQQLSILYDVGAYRAAGEALKELRALFGADDARVRSSEGLLHADAGRPALAHASFEVALRGERSKASFRRGTLLNLARADIERGTPEHALEHLDEAQALVDTAISKTAVAAYRARVANALGDSRGALALAVAALALEPIDDWRWELELEAGRAAAAIGDVGAAERHYRAAIDALDEIRRGFDRSDFKQAVLARKRAPYDALVDLYVGMGRDRDALAVAERARARTLVEAMVDADHAGLDTSTRAAQAALSVPFDAALAALGEAHAVAYYRTATAVHRFEVAGGEVRSTRLEVGGDELDVLARALRANPDDRLAATALGEALGPPRAHRLYVITDGEVANAPVAAVRVQGRYWAERSELAFAPSLRVLAALSQRPVRAGGRAVVLGDPRGDLPAARREATRVAAALSGELHLGPDAGGERVRAAATARVLHIAAHAGDGGLRLADGVLSANDVVTARLAPDLVVLATCVGAAQEDGGLWGSLASSFLVAGARVVLASPGTVDDARTRELVESFYAAGGVQRPAAALAAAQRNAIRRGVAPSTWSSLRAIGLAHPPAEET